MPTVAIELRSEESTNSRYTYSVSQAAAAVFCALFAISGLLAIIQSVRTRAWIWIVMLIAIGGKSCPLDHIRVSQLKEIFTKLRSVDTPSGSSPPRTPILERYIRPPSRSSSYLLSSWPESSTSSSVASSSSSSLPLTVASDSSGPQPAGLHPSLSASISSPC